MGLHVHVFGAEEFLGAINSKVLDDVHELAPTVVAAPRIAFGVFVGKQRACRLENSTVCEVFRCDQFQTGRLASLFMPNSGVDFRVKITEWSRDAVHISSCSGRFLDGNSGTVALTTQILLANASKNSGN